MVDLEITRFSYPGCYPEACEPEAPWTFEVQLNIDPWWRGKQKLYSAQLVEPACCSDEPYFVGNWEITPSDEEREFALKQCLSALQEGMEVGISDYLPDVQERRLDALADLADFLKDCSAADFCIVDSADEVPALRVEEWV